MSTRVLLGMLFCLKLTYIFTTSPSLPHLEQMEYPLTAPASHHIISYRPHVPQLVSVAEIISRDTTPSVPPLSAH